MRICQVQASWAEGGLEKHGIELANALAREHEVTVIAHPSMQGRFSAGVRVLPVDFDRGRWSPGLHRDLLKALRSEPWDVVHAQANKAATLVGRLRPWTPARAWVATLHNRKGSTRMFDRFDRVIAVSPGIAGLVRQAPVSVVYNGIRAPAPAAPDRQKLAGEFGFEALRPILVAIGRLVEAKGLDLLVDAAARSGVQVLIIGDGPLREPLAARIAGTRAPVALAGFRADAQALMALSDGLVISSRNEGGPYTLPEALLAGVPVIATDVGMVGEFLPASLIAPPGDVERLAGLMQWAAGQPGEWRQALLPVFARARAELTLDAMAERTLAVYAQALQARES